MKFPFRHSLADGARTDGYDSDSIRLYDSESEDDEHYLWQPPPDKRRHTTEKFYKVGLSAFRSKSFSNRSHVDLGCKLCSFGD